jgi:opacity protein-like surface antigen
MKKYSQLSLLSAGVSVAALVLASTATFAAANYKGESYKGEAVMPAPCPVEKPLKDGFYVGAQVGYDSYRASQSYTLTGTTASANGNNVNNTTGWAGGLFAGYGQYFQDAYYLAGEVMVNTSGANQTNTNNVTISGTTTTQTTKFSVNNGYGVRLLPGVKLNNSSLLYIPLGYMNTSLKNTTSLTSATGSSKSQYTGGWAYGLGFETAVYENFSLRGEYTHTSYNSFSNNGVKVTPYDNQVMLGLLYHFA